MYFFIQMERTFISKLDGSSDLLAKLCLLPNLDVTIHVPIDAVLKLLYDMWFYFLRYLFDKTRWS